MVYHITTMRTRHTMMYMYIHVHVHIHIILSCSFKAYQTGGICQKPSHDVSVEEVTAIPPHRASVVIGTSVPWRRGHEAGVVLMCRRNTCM